MLNGVAVLKSRSWLKFWPRGVLQTIDYPDIPLFELLRNTAKKHPEHTAIIFQGKRITYNELDVLSDKLATALDSLGVKKKDCVALFLPNIPQYIISYYGALKVGAFVTAISPLAKERETKFQLSGSEAEIIVCLDISYPIVKDAQKETRIEQIIVASIKEYLSPMKAVSGTLFKKMPTLKIAKEPGVHFFKELLSKHSAQPPDVEINPKEDLAALQYTGGTIGVPKGAMLTHSNLVSNALMCAEWFQGKETEDIMLTVLPLFHIYGMTTSMNAPIHLADTMILLPRPDLIEILKAIQESCVTIFCGVPTLYAKLLAHPDINKYNLKSVRFCISGAAPLPPKVQKKFMDLIGGVLVEGYGLTEASPVTHSNPLDPTMKTVKVGSIGLPLPDTEAKIVDIKTGEKAVRQGQVGELVVKGPQVMKGYWKMPEETKAVLKDGWLYTGDVGKMDEDGYFYITDRKKDLIKYKGYSVYPKELEDIIYEHLAVKLCSVIGKPKPVVGEIPKAFIVLREGADASEEEIIKFVKERVAVYKTIREVEFRKELPISLIGKVIRRKLQEEELKKMKAV